MSWYWQLLNWFLLSRPKQFCCSCCNSCNWWGRSSGRYSSSSTFSSLSSKSFWPCLNKLVGLCTRLKWSFRWFACTRDQTTVLVIQLLNWKYHVVHCLQYCKAPSIFYGASPLSTLVQKKQHHGIDSKFGFPWPLSYSALQGTLCCYSPCCIEVTQKLWKLVPKLWGVVFALGWAHHQQTQHII